ncbi:uncharacterized protein LOC132261513 [Phlebotomus argentipes]|uniref:uncharacterized protein LOC132261513 n=1 Tax=Phlebotomus argentipes TaxID=94469 RepID=UPI0028931C11|nr:uncharacterized protein LOC132261513 [Phlebotomus argentipes]
MDGLSTEKALLMEVALELLGNTIYDVFGTRQTDLIQLFSDNAMSSVPSVQSQSSGPSRTSTNSQQSLLRPIPERLLKADTSSSNGALNDQPWELESTRSEQEDQDFVEDMMRKIEDEFSQLMKSSKKHLQSYFMDFWENAASTSNCPDFSEEDIQSIADDYFTTERRALERICKVQKDAVMLMKDTASSPEEVERVRRITQKIALVKDRVEKDLA